MHIIAFALMKKLKNKKKEPKQKKLPYAYNRKCRELDEKNAPKNIKPVLRFKSKIEGSSSTKRFGSRRC